MSEPTFDYRDLLKRYIAHVGYEEGSTFLGVGALAEYGGPFSPEELAELERIDAEAVDVRAQSRTATQSPPRMSIAGEPVTKARVGETLRFRVEVSGGKGPYVYGRPPPPWRDEDEDPAPDNWPRWLMCNAATGEIVGTPDRPGVWRHIVVQATDMLGNTINLAAFDIEVVA